MSETISSETGTAIGSGQERILEIRDASVTYQMSRGESRVLDNVSCDINQGEILGIVGESGSGKSMFASSIIDMVEDPGITRGDVTYYPPDGQPIDMLSLSDEELRSVRWEEISYVMQASQSGFNPTMKIGDHFEETIRAHGMDLEEHMDHGRKLLSDMYLNPEQVMSSYPGELSGGMKQRALIALGLVLDPNVLILDEPTASLDLLMQRSIVSLIEDMQDEYGWTVIFVTHDLPLLTDIADRIGVMYAYELIEIGPIEDMLNNPSHPYTRALLNAVPNISAHLEEMAPIPGSSPDPVNVPTGCSYHPRCPLADSRCRQNDPSFHRVNDDHRSKCFYWEDAPDAVKIADPKYGTFGLSPEENNE